MPLAERRPMIPLERMPISDVLSCVEPFTAARPEEIELLAKSTVRFRKAASTVLIAEGRVPDGLYVVLRGRVNLVRMGDGGRDLILSTLGPGDVLGESCAFDQSGMSTSAVAATPVELLRIPGEAISAHVRREPETMVRLVRLLSDKLRDIENVASSLALHDVEERLRRTLVRLVRRQGRRAPAASGWILAPVPTQSELARMVGSCRETVSRTLSAMARNGLVSSSGRRMVLDASLLGEATETDVAA
ncbi:MAG: Crp/Fnr family transcriptional regulator [Deltaproteobacteria bacterium]|nr:Crp/Fnr family transcriptional regulator [Deltaproteobacteria bacterium]